MLAKLTDLKSRLGIGGNGEDALLTLILGGAGAAVERYCDREIAYIAADQTEYLDGGLAGVRVRRWPITEVVSIKEASDFVWGNATALVADSEYRVTGGTRNRGEILRMPEGLTWLCGRDVVRVVYRGGYNDPASLNIPGVEYMPSAIQEACLIQATYLYQRRQQVGGGAVSVGQMGQVTAQESVRLIAAAAELLRGQRRM